SALLGPRRGPALESLANLAVPVPGDHPPVPLEVHRPQFLPAFVVIVPQLGITTPERRVFLRARDLRQRPEHESILGDLRAWQHDALDGAAAIAIGEDVDVERPAGEARLRAVASMLRLDLLER